MRREEQLGDLRRGDGARDEPDRRRGHREPEGRPDNGGPPGIVLRVEVEAEERHRDAGAQDDHEHHGERDQRVHRAQVAAGEVPRDDRQQEEPDQARDDRAQPIDGRMLPEPPELTR